LIPVKADKARNFKHAEKVKGDVMRKLATGIALVAVAGLWAPVRAATDSGIDPRIVTGCESCHGPQGDSKSADVPRLNGQQSAYIKLRLKQFLDPTRGSPHATYEMWERSSQLGDRITDSLSRYFAGQAATPAAPNGSLAQQGEAIYRHGAGSEIPACQSCHGAEGEGQGAVPRLAGQHGEYLIQQMNALMLTMRVSAPMNHHAWHLKPDQIAALSAYLAND
jgi:cytochrome c553